MIKRKKLLVFIIATLIFTGSYMILDQSIILDRTDQVLGEYDFGASKPDIELIVEGTGVQKVEGQLVSTKLKIVGVNINKTHLKVEIGSEFIGYEYFAVVNNRQVSRIPLFPGRSIYGMGTSYKRLKKGERGKVYLNYDEQLYKLWIMPKELIEK